MNSIDSPLGLVAQAIIKLSIELEKEKNAKQTAETQNAGLARANTSLSKTIDEHELEIENLQRKLAEANQTIAGKQSDIVRLTRELEKVAKRLEKKSATSSTDGKPKPQ